MKHLGKTRPFRGPKGELVPGDRSWLEGSIHRRAMSSSRLQVTYIGGPTALLELGRSAKTIYA